MKTTIRTFIFTAAVMLAAASCQKSAEPVLPVEEGKGTIDIRVNGLMGEYNQVDATKAELVNTVRVSWTGGETVYVYDGTQCLGSLVASLDGTGDNRYAILSTDGSTHTVSDPASGTTKLTLVYSPLLTSAPTVSNGAISISLTAQNGAKAPFVAYATLDWTGTSITSAIVPFKFATSVIRVNCIGLKANTAITSATLSNVNTACKLTLSKTAAPTVAGDAIGSIIRTGDSSFATGEVNSEGEAVFQIAVPNLETATEARVLTVAQDSNYSKDKKFSNKAMNPATSVNTVCQLVGLPAGALPGEFSVSDTKQVYFSRGNLTYDVNESTNNWKFYEHQYDCATVYDANLISLFTWGYSETYSIVPDGNKNNNVNRTSGNLDQGEDWGSKMGDGNTWRTLSSDEWKYLLDTRKVNGGNGENKIKRATINSDVNGGVSGMILYPDNYTSQTSAESYTSSDWTSMETAGCVFLPYAGLRIGPKVQNANYGCYWSSTAYNSNYAYSVYFNNGTVYYSRYNNLPRSNGCSVRLITECQ